MKRIVLVLALLLVGASCTRTPDKHPRPLPVQQGQSDISVAGSCVETYSLETLKDREIAFDGVVAEVVTTESPSSVQGEGPETRYDVRFDVNRWFKGGSGDATTLRSSIPLGDGDGAVTSVDGIAITKGSRYLVSGDGGFIWSCGFTSEYSEAEAASWANTLGAG
ncbi:MAG TPA: hypothetical protein VI541_05115 [Actinomycetota bacterium]|nr:hypothetical protein [Actinomycetota bacterium]